MTKRQTGKRGKNKLLENWAYLAVGVFFLFLLINPNLFSIYKGYEDYEKGEFVALEGITFTKYYYPFSMIRAYLENALIFDMETGEPLPADEPDSSFLSYCGGPCSYYYNGDHDCGVYPEIPSERLEKWQAVLRYGGMHQEGWSNAPPSNEFALIPTGDLVVEDEYTYGVLKFSINLIADNFHAGMREDDRKKAVCRFFAQVDPEDFIEQRNSLAYEAPYGQLFTWEEKKFRVLAASEELPDIVHFRVHCLYPEGFEMISQSFEANDTISLEALDRPAAYFCKEFPAILTDEIGREVSTDYIVYRQLTDKETFVVPEDQTWRIIYFTLTEELQNKACISNDDCLVPCAGMSAWCGNDYKCHYDGACIVEPTPAFDWEKVTEQFFYDLRVKIIKLLGW